MEPAEEQRGPGRLGEGRGKGEREGKGGGEVRRGGKPE